MAHRIFESFTNEVGNPIKITVVSGIDSVSFQIEGPTSVGEQILTPLEAQTLARMLTVAAKPKVIGHEFTKETP